MQKFSVSTEGLGPLILGPNLHLRKHGLDTRPSFLSTGDDLVRWKNETKSAGVAELSCECGFDLADVDGPVDAVAVGLVDDVANRAGLESSAVNGAEGLGECVRQREECVVVARAGRAAVTVCYLRGD